MGLSMSGLSLFHASSPHAINVSRKAKGTSAGAGASPLGASVRPVADPSEGGPAGAAAAWEDDQAAGNSDGDGDRGDRDDERAAQAKAVGASEDLDLMYDPMLNCYYDPKTNKYYELC